MAARLARRHVARAAWADAGMGVPPQPTPARLLPSVTMRHVILPPLPKAAWHPAATAKGGMAHYRHCLSGMCHSSCATHPAATAKGGMAHHRHCLSTCRTWGWRHPHAGVGPDGTCHVSPGQTCRHPQGVLFDKKNSQGVFSSISLAQVV
jgi:hypothetical protein